MVQRGIDDDDDDEEEEEEIVAWCDRRLFRDALLV